VSLAGQPGLTSRTMDPRRKQQAGLTVTELVCVMAIILILMALYLPAIARVYKRVVTFLGGMSG
jgi:prepilin-type N-terminal cleavage/methylation domain-containing protein